jgi:hypothetical protein
MSSNLHKIPVNFETRTESHPFKIFIKKNNENAFECSIEQNSLVYDFYNDKEVKIDGLDKSYVVQGNENVYLTLNYQQAGLVISKASIRIGSYDLTEYSPCFPNDPYYGQNVQCVSKTDTIIGLIVQPYENAELYVEQYINRHITKYACYSFPSQF